MKKITDEQVLHLPTLPIGTGLPWVFRYSLFRIRASLFFPLQMLKKFPFPLICSEYSTACEIIKKFHLSLSNIKKN